MIAAETLIVPLLQAFFWFDDGLQSYLQSRGWDQVTRPQSMVMAFVVVGVNKPSEIARHLGISRQSVHTTINQMVKMDMLELHDDPEDGRTTLVTVSAKGQAMGRDAADAMAALTAELKRRIGARNTENLVTAFRADWGRPPTEWATPPRAKRGRRATPGRTSGQSK